MRLIAVALGVAAEKGAPAIPDPFDPAEEEPSRPSADTIAGTPTSVAKGFATLAISLTTEDPELAGGATLPIFVADVCAVGLRKLAAALASAVGVPEEDPA